MFDEDTKCCGKLAGHDEDEKASRDYGRDGDDKRDHRGKRSTDDHCGSCGKQGVAACISGVEDHPRGDGVINAADNTGTAGEHVHETCNSNAATELSLGF